MRTLLGWLRARLLREAEWHDEIQSHLEMRQAWNEARGLPAQDARSLTRRQFGNVLATLEQVRAVHICSWLESLWQDARYAGRNFAKAPAFCAVVIATVAIGIGASTAVFSVVDPLLFRALPYPHDEQLVSVGYFGPIDNNEFNVVSSYLDWRERQTPFQAITSMRPGSQCALQTDATARQVSCYAVEANFLKTFGIAPVIGRDFTREDDRPRAPAVVLVSFALWQSRFGGNSSMLGQTVMLDEEPARIIGVLPNNFEMPQLGEVDVLFPERLDAALPRATNAGSALRTFARLRNGVSIDQARRAMQPLFEETSRKDTPATLLTEVRLVVRSLRDRQIHDVKLASWMLLGAVVTLLLTTCANVANLLLARAAARRRELAMRAAIGAGRRRLIRQMLTETLLLGLAGGLAGCGTAWVLLHVFIGVVPEGLLHLNRAHIDFRVLLFAAGASLAAALLFGIAPALQRPRPQLLAGRHAAGPMRARFRQTLVATQVALSVLLLSGASLFLRSLWKLEGQALGFQPQHVVTISFTLPRQRYRAPAVQAAFLQTLEQRLQRLPGAGSFALSDSIPPRGSMGRPYSNLRIAARPQVAANGGLVAFRWVTPGYFAALGIPILAGRDFTEEERAGSTSPLILSATLARRLFGNENPIGQQIDLDVSGRWLPVIGVAADVKNSGIAEAPDPEYYRLRLNDARGIPRSAVAIFRTSLDPATLTRWIRQEFREADPSLPVTIETMEARVGRFTQQLRFVALLVALFAGCAVLLAAIGIYGVLSFLVAQQTREIGVRIALGARPRDIAVQVQHHILAWTAAGIAVGLAASLLVTPPLRGLLFGVTPNDAMSLAAGVLVLTVVAATAAWGPSHRATRVDPVVALRHE